MIFLASLAVSTEDKLEGYQLIKTKTELEKIIADNTKVSRVLIRKDFAQEYFTPSGILIFIQNAKMFNRNLIIELEEQSNGLIIDKFIEKLKIAKSPEELTTLSIMYPKEFKDSIERLVKEELSRQNELLAAANKVSRFQTIIEEQRRQINELEHSVELERTNKYAASAKLDALIKRINYRYNVDIEVDKLFTVDKNRFDKVIYIKEYSRVQYMDSFVYYLKEILKILYSMPTRLVVIEAYYGSLTPQLYPDLVPHYKLKERDAISGDILMMGLQPKLMTDILKNSSRVSILIILDRGMYKTPHLKGDNIEYFYTVSNNDDIPEDIPKSRIFSYSEKTLFIPYIKDFKQLDSSAKIAKYSSMVAMKRVIKAVEGR